MKRYVMPLIITLLACTFTLGAQPPEAADIPSASISLPAADSVSTEITVIDIPPTETDTLPALKIINERWTLRECIDRARSKNTLVLREELMRRDASIKLRQARLEYIPHVGITSTSETSLGKTVTLPSTTSEVIEEFEISANITTDLFAGFRKHHTLKRSELEAEAVAHHIDKVRNELELEVTYAYLNVLLAEERVDIVENQIATLEAQLLVTRKMVDEGTRETGDILQMEAQLTDARHQSLLTYNQRLIAYFTLCQLLEIDDYRDFHIIAPQSIQMQLNMSPESTTEIFSAAQSLPQIQSANIGIDIADRNVKLAKAGLYPTLNLSTGYRSEYDYPLSIPRRAFSRQIKDNANAYFLFTLNIPIFNSLSTRSKIETNRISRLRAEYDLRLAQKQIYQEIQEAFIDAHGSLEQYIASVQNVESSDNSLRDVEKRYARGRATSSDYIIAVYNCTNSRNQLALAKYQYIYKNKLLDFYTGVPIDL